MQSYEVYVVPESLDKRHPYLQEPFTGEIDPKQITLAIKERSVPKLTTVLVNEGVEAEIKRDALKTLNELVSHQETKEIMIKYNVIEATSPLLENENIDVRREAVSLIGSLANSEQGRKRIHVAFKGLQQQLTDEEPAVQEVDAWALCRLSTNREGCELIASNKLATSMVVAFIRYTNPMFFKKELCKFFSYLLEAFINITEYDNGIMPMLGTGSVAALRDILQSDYSNDFDIFKQKIHEQTLKLLGNISVNHKGKDECIKELVIEATWPYLSSYVLQERIYSAYTLMSCAIHLQGKYQIAQKMDEENNPVIIQRLVEKLLEKDKDLRLNAKIALSAVSDLPEGFHKVTEQMAGKVDLLDELFGARAVKSLAELLPPLSSFGGHPFEFEPHKMAKNQLYVKYITYFIKKYEASLRFAINDTINIAEKLAVYLNPSTKAHVEALYCLKQICKTDSYQALVFRKFLEVYGDMEFSKPMSKEMTTVRKELSSPLGAELIELANNANPLQ